ncbi:Protein phosphatase 2C family [Phytophthora cactorum]|nr:Protein phosphatase 2C family [Phytophthora cactorum]
MASLRRFLHRDTPPPASWQPDESFASRASHAHRERAETAPSSQLEAANNEQGTAIPVPNSARISSFSRFFERAGGRSSSSSSSSSSDGDDLEGAELRLWRDIWRSRAQRTPNSGRRGGSSCRRVNSSITIPRRRQGAETHGRHVLRSHLHGEHRLGDDSGTTCLLHLVAEELNEAEARTPMCRCYLCLARPLLLLANLRLRPLSHTHIQKDFGVAAFQIRMESRRYVLRAESKDMMHEWLFNFQKSIANIVSALSRTQWRFLASTSFSDESTGGDGSSSSRTSPRRASSPLAFGGFGPRSPLMFAFDPMDDVPEHHTPPVRQSSIAETKEESIDHDGQLHLGGRWRRTRTQRRPLRRHQLFRRRRPRSQQASTSLDIYGTAALQSRPHLLLFQSTCPHLRSLHLLLLLVAGCLATREKGLQRCSQSSRSHQHPRLFSRDLNEDSSSYSTGDDVHGVTSLLGVRSAMEDVCCCIPDLNAHLKDDQPHHQRQSFYALFDGHSGVRAATFSNQRLVSYLTLARSFYVGYTTGF